MEASNKLDDRLQRILKPMSDEVRALTVRALYFSESDDESPLSGSVSTVKQQFNAFSIPCEMLLKACSMNDAIMFATVSKSSFSDRNLIIVLQCVC